MKSNLFKFWDFFTHSINIDFSFSNGSKSEKLLIDGNFIIPIFISGFVERDFFSSKSRESSGGNVSFSHGIMPMTGI